MSANPANPANPVPQPDPEMAKRRTRFDASLFGLSALTILNIGAVWFSFCYPLCMIILPAASVLNLLHPAWIVGLNVLTITFTLASTIFWTAFFFKFSKPVLARPRGYRRLCLFWLVPVEDQDEGEDDVPGENVPGGVPGGHGRVGAGQEGAGNRAQQQGEGFGGWFELAQLAANRL
ncbi:hypothetical protein B0T20DRAFT_2413 [Sordaria brevicollis]|uniref:Uncharacterized protein n=1 Tax=Sordaria brevicollis TaxID=83679 RepID=A0AAE0PMP0_SORBR|nr:hypothetical protein B0T20DRAFT_2413 [Sordaria brevicollis]